MPDIADHVTVTQPGIDFAPAGPTTWRDRLAEAFSNAAITAPQRFNSPGEAFLGHLAASAANTLGKSNENNPKSVANRRAILSLNKTIAATDEKRHQQSIADQKERKKEEKEKQKEAAAAKAELAKTPGTPEYRAALQSKIAAEKDLAVGRAAAGLSQAGKTPTPKKAKAARFDVMPEADAAAISQAAAAVKEAEAAYKDGTADEQAVKDARASLYRTRKRRVLTLLGSADAAQAEQVMRSIPDGDVLARDQQVVDALAKVKK